MKLGKYILGLALIAAGLTSCDQDNVGAIYEPTVANISFLAPGQSTLTDQTTIEVPVAVGRAITDGTYTANVTLEGAPANMSLKSNQVTFADGEGIAYAIVVVNGMSQGSTYVGTLKLSSADMATANPDFGEQMSSTTVEVMCDFDWEELGDGFYSSPDWWEEEFYVPIIHAKGSNIYRMIGLFEEGYDIEFTIESDNKVYVASQRSWFYNSSYGDV